MVTNSHVCSMCSFSLILAEISQTMCCYTAGSTTVRFNIACELLKNVPKGKKRFKLPIYPNLSCLSTDSKQAGFFFAIFISCSEFETHETVHTHSLQVFRLSLTHRTISRDNRSSLRNIKAPYTLSLPPCFRQILLLFSFFSFFLFCSG